MRPDEPWTEEPGLETRGAGELGRDLIADTIGVAWTGVGEVGPKRLRGALARQQREIDAFARNRIDEAGGVPRGTSRGR